MKESPFKTIDEQIILLKERNLNFLDENYAKKKLLAYGYYEIVNGFKDFLLENKNPDVFKENETFEHLLSIYKLDKNFQHYLLRTTLEVELLLKTALSYTIAKTYGEKESSYLIRTNYKQGKKYTSNDGIEFYTIDNLFRKFKKIINDDNNPFKHYKDEYNNIPPWILMKGLTFGNCVEFLKLQKTDIKNEIFSILTGIPTNIIKKDKQLKDFLMSVLNLTCKFRNRVAHCSRVYNHKPKKAFLSYFSPFHDGIGVSKTKYSNKNIGKNDLFSLCKAFEYFKSNQPDLMIKISLEYYIKEHLKSFPNDKYKLLSEMGVTDKFIDLDIEEIFK